MALVALHDAVWSGAAAWRGGMARLSARYITGHLRPVLRSSLSFPSLFHANSLSVRGLG